MNPEAVAQTLVARPVKARSLIVTFFGDVVSVQPSRVWLGSLIGVMGSLGLGEHLVRTTCNRLVKEGWLQSHQQGRRSYFGFSDYGARQYSPRRLSDLRAAKTGLGRLLDHRADPRP